MSIIQEDQKSEQPGNFSQSAAKMLNVPAKPLERVIDAASSENKEIQPSSKKSPMMKL
jgi:hypothetical protein